MSRLRPTLCFVALGAILLWVGLVLLRVTYPGVLEWQEGGMLAHVLRVRAGRPLYVQPSLEFIAFPYPPLYTWVVVLLGDGLVTLRLVSIGASVGTLVLLGAWVRRAGGGVGAGLVAAGIYAAAYRFGGAWFDVGRVDSLALFFALAALYLGRFGKGRGSAWAGGLCCALALLTKQTALLICLPLALHLGRRGRIYGLAAILGGGGALGILHLMTEGWSTWTLFTLPAGHAWLGPWAFLWRDLPWILPALLLAPRTRVPAAVLLGMVAAAWLGRAHAGGAENNLLPLALGAALVLGEGLAPAAGAGKGVTGKREWITGLLVLAQFSLLAYDPRPLLPSRADRAALERVRARLDALDGPLFAPHQVELAGESCAHAQAIIDLLSSSSARDEAARFVGELERALASRRFAAVLLAEPWPDLPALMRSYPRVVDLLADLPPERLRPPSGFPHRPRWLYLPR